MTSTVRPSLRRRPGGITALTDMPADMPEAAPPQRHDSPASGPGRRLTSKTKAHRGKDE